MEVFPDALSLSRVIRNADIAVGFFRFDTIWVPELVLQALASHRSGFLFFNKIEETVVPTLASFVVTKDYGCNGFLDFCLIRTKLAHDQ